MEKTGVGRPRRSKEVVDEDRRANYVDVDVDVDTDTQWTMCCAIRIPMERRLNL